MSKTPLEGELLPAGRPSTYKPEYCEKIIDAAAQGKHIAGMMMAINVKSKETWYEWKKKYPEFNSAVEFATNVVSKAFYEEVGLRGMMGEIEKFNATTWATVMNNKFKDEYSRGPNGAGTEITINTVNYSSEEMTQKIAQKLEKMKSLGVDLSGV